MVFLCRFFLCFFLLTAPALAGQIGQTPLIYTPVGDDLRVRSITEFLLNTKRIDSQIPFDMAETDLNGDGVEEVIFRQQPSGCEARADCLFLITGVSRKKPALLGTIHARNIGIAEEKSYGVKKILVYNQKQNDFRYITYAWDPYQSSFTAP